MLPPRRDFEKLIGTIGCNTCMQKWECHITKLYDPIDVYVPPHPSAKNLFSPPRWPSHVSLTNRVMLTPFRLRYSDWIDACEDVNKGGAAKKARGNNNDEDDD